MALHARPLAGGGACICASHWYVLALLETIACPMMVTGENGRCSMVLLFCVAADA
eukprot:COSAG05_NODE_18772_length_303_cov_0.764706_1_plen_54_part_01